MRSNISKNEQFVDCSGGAAETSQFMASKASEIRLKGERLREKEKYLEAVQVVDEAVLFAQE